MKVKVPKNTFGKLLNLRRMCIHRYTKLGISKTGHSPWYLQIHFLTYMQSIYGSKVQDIVVMQENSRLDIWHSQAWNFQILMIREGIFTQHTQNNNNKKKKLQVSPLWQFNPTLLIVMWLGDSTWLRYELTFKTLGWQFQGKFSMLLDVSSIVDNFSWNLGCLLIHWPNSLIRGFFFFFSLSMKIWILLIHCDSIIIF